MRLDHVPPMLERCLLFAAAQHAFGLYRWFVKPDRARLAAIAEAATHLEAVGDTYSPLLGAALGVHAWLDKGGERPPLRVALARYWQRRGVTALLCPLLTGAQALHADTPWARESWIGHFLAALADEAEDGIALLRLLERHWFAARLLDGFVGLGIAREVTPRAKRRFYGLTYLAPLRAAAAIAADPGAGRTDIAALLAAAPPLPPLARTTFEFAELDQ